MQIIWLEKYRCGYRGIAREPAHWVLFQFSRRVGLQCLASYDRADFKDDDHFIGLIGRFVPNHRFLSVPIVLDRPDAAGFDRLWEALSNELR